MTRPTARVLALLEILQTGGWFTVGELAGRLGVDERTVRRYATHLTDLGIPVGTRRGRYGGYRLSPGFKLPPLMFTDDEAIAVTLGLVAGERMGLGGGAFTGSALAKVRRVLPDAVAGRIESLLATADFTALPRQAAPAGSEVLLTLAAAARDRHPVRITYTSWAGGFGDRVLEPYGLVFHSGRWYASGHDSASGEVRTFRLDRITAAESIEGSFEVPDGFDPTGHVLAGLASVPYAHEVVVVLRATLAEARRRLPRVVGDLAEVEGGVRLTMRAERLDGAARMLAGLPWRFTVERPAALIDEIRTLAAQLVEDAGHASGGSVPADDSVRDPHGDRDADGGTHDPREPVEQHRGPDPAHDAEDHADDEPDPPPV
ncbi:helix-turn-helix transcriptional regulator [Virgisporangium aurantiacum]|uniref:Transcriptional regulator n=1 Tax=Virgisporangium aurantiacum TaxID=175570 RepID=A0A8J4E616_9ACTN|nr:YafY family protein [Virgisporangium aurantiacum]GIJ62936.1 transcriptional regulator [Virgisporangium aurantiacum]